MIGSKLFLVGVAVTIAISSVTADDLADGLSALTGGLSGGAGLGGNLGNALGGGLGGLGDLFGAKKEGGNSLLGLDKTEAKSSTDIAKKEGEGFLGIKGPAELIKLLLNPFELCAKIAEHFKLPFDKFFPVVSKGINFGLELAVQPLILSLKIIEKVFVPDNCKLKFVCGLAHTLSFTRDIVPKLGDKTLNESRIFKALCDGIHGNCDSIYQCDGQPKIKDEYKDQQKGNKQDEQKYEGAKKEGHHGGEQEEPNYSASNIFKSLKSKN